MWKCRFVLLTSLLALSATAAPFTVHGFADGYFAWNDHGGDNFEPGTGTTAKHANELDLNLAAIEIAREPAPFGFHVSLVTGSGADVVHAAEPEGLKHVYQASMLYQANEKLLFEAGVFPSHIGYESFFSKDNWNYTRSWLSEFSTYYQAGLRTNYRFNDRWSGEVHVLQGWQVIDDNNSAKSIGVKVAYSTDRLSASLNTMHGPELEDDANDWRHFGDLIATYKVTPKLSVGGSVDRGHQLDADWFGVAGYTRYAVSDRHAVAVRLERFHDPDNGISGTPQTVSEGTVTYEFRPRPNLILKLEGRRDHSTANVFDGSRNETLLIAGAVATF